MKRYLALLLACSTLFGQGTIISRYPEKTNAPSANDLFLVHDSQLTNSQTRTLKYSSLANAISNSVGQTTLAAGTNIVLQTNGATVTINASLSSTQATFYTTPVPFSSVTVEDNSGIDSFSTVPSLVLQTNRLIMVYRNATTAGHAPNDSSLYLRSSTDGGVTWSARSQPAAFISVPTYEHTNIFLATTVGDVELRVNYTYEGPQESYALPQTVESTDGGATWSAATAIGGGLPDRAGGRALELASGDILHPAYELSGGNFKPYVAIEAPGGGVSYADITAGYGQWSDTLLLEDPDTADTVYAFLKNSAGTIGRAVSADGGSTWSAITPIITFAGSAGPVDGIYLASGQLVLSVPYNRDTGVLQLWASDTDGASFSYAATVVPDEAAVATHYGSVAIINSTTLGLAYHQDTGSASTIHFITIPIVNGRLVGSQNIEAYQVALPQGTASDPSLKFDTEAGLGLYRKASNVIAVASIGVDQIKFATAGLGMKQSSGPTAPEAGVGWLYPSNDTKLYFVRGDGTIDNLSEGELPRAELFGAVANDANDDRAAIVSCLTTYGQCYLGKGVYIISSKLPIASYQQLIGAGMSNTVLRLQDASAAVTSTANPYYVMVGNDPGGTATDYALISGITFDVNSRGQSRTDIAMDAIYLLGSGNRVAYNQFYDYGNGYTNKEGFTIYCVGQNSQTGDQRGAVVVGNEFHQPRDQTGMPFSSTPSLTLIQVGGGAGGGTAVGAIIADNTFIGLSTNGAAMRTPIRMMSSGKARGLYVTGNLSKDTYGVGYYQDTWAVRELVIENNQFIDCQYGVGLHGGTGTYTDVTIRNNQIVLAGTNITGWIPTDVDPFVFLQYGISLYAAPLTNTIVQQNIIRGPSSYSYTGTNYYPQPMRVVHSSSVVEDLRITDNVLDGWAASDRPARMQNDTVLSATEYNLGVLSDINGSSIPWVIYNAGGSIVSTNWGSGVTRLVLTEAAAPPTAPSGKGLLWANSADSKPYYISDTGTSYDLTTGAGGGTSVYVEGASVSNPNFKGSAGVTLPVTAATNVTVTLAAALTNVVNNPAMYQATNATLTRLQDIGVGASGDVFIRDATGWTNLVKGSDGTVLKLSSGLPVWGTDQTGGGGASVWVNDVEIAAPNFDDASQVAWGVSGTNVTASIVANSIAGADISVDATLETEIEAVVDLQDLQGAVTDGQVPNNITIDQATLALTGDSATAFFSTGTLEDARIASTIARDSEVAAGYQPLDSDLSNIAGLVGVEGDIIYRDASQWQRLGIGSASQVLQVSGTAPVWNTVPNPATMAIGPGPSVTDNALPRFNGTGGYLLQGSGVTIDDLNNATFPANVDIAGTNTIDTLQATNLVLDATGTVDLGAGASFEVPNSAAPTTDAFGELAGDNDAWAASRGALQFYDGTANTYIIGVLASDTPSANQVPKFNAAGYVVWEDDATGGGGVGDGDKGDVVVTSSGTVWTIDSDTVTDGKLRNSAATSVIGRGANSVGDPGDILTTTDGQVLRRAAGALAFGALDLADTDAVTGQLDAVRIAGGGVTSTEFNYIGTLTSDAQTQISARALTDGGYLTNAVYVAIGATNVAAELAGKQGLDGELTALAGLTSAADALPYFTGSGTAGTTTLTAYGRSFIDDADEATFKATVNLEIGTDVQAYDADLTTWAGITPGAGVGTWLATPSSANLQGALTDEVGTGPILSVDGGYMTNAVYVEIGSTNVAAELAGKLGEAEASALYQATNANLTTWAGITPGAGIGTWLATPSSANLQGALTDEVGTGPILSVDGGYITNAVYIEIGSTNVAAELAAKENALTDLASLVTTLSDVTWVTTDGDTFTGDVTGTIDTDGSTALTIADSVTVTGWDVGVSIATTPAVSDNDTSIATTEFVQGERRIVTKNTATSYTVGTTDARESYGGVIYVTGAATITLPAAAAGMSCTIITVGAVAVSVDPNAADRIVLDGVTTLDDGDKATNTSTTGDMIVCTYYSADGWYAASNGWTDGGP